MYVRALWLVGSALVLGTASGLSQAQPGDEPGAADVQEKFGSCKGRYFETIVKIETDGEPRGKRIRICGDVGTTEADWKRTLEDAIEELRADQSMSAPVRDQIIAAISADIEKLSDSQPPIEQVAVDPAPPPPLGEPLPVQSSQIAPTVAEKAPAPPAKPATAAAARPRLSLGCSVPSSAASDGPCIVLQRDTMLILKADAAMAGAANLRFLRRGDLRAEVGLSPMRRGQRVQLRLPPELCGGVSRSEVEIVVAARGANGAADSLGRFPLRC